MPLLDRPTNGGCTRVDEKSIFFPMQVKKIFLFPSDLPPCELLSHSMAAAVDDAFLARMQRPTAASAARTAEARRQRQRHQAAVASSVSSSPRRPVSASSSSAAQRSPGTRMATPATTPQRPRSAASNASPSPRPNANHSPNWNPAGAVRSPSASGSTPSETGTDRSHRKRREGSRKEARGLSVPPAGPSLESLLPAPSAPAEENEVRVWQERKWDGGRTTE